MGEELEIKRLLQLISLNEDEAAYKQLFILLYNRLRQFAYSILKSNEEADELISDVFLAIWRKKEKLGLVESPRIYIYSMVKNMALNRINNRKKQVKVAPEEWLVQLNSVYFDPEKLMLSEETFRKVKQAVNELPTRCKLIFKLIREDGLKYREVAELLNLSIKTVETQMAIALKRIGQCMHIDIRNAYSHHFSKKR